MWSLKIKSLIFILLLFNANLLLTQEIVSVKGYVLLKHNSSPIESYPVKIYTSVDDTSTSYTVYTAKNGYFSFSWQNNDASNQALISINSYTNGTYDPVIDTIKISETITPAKYYITPKNLRYLFLDGYVFDDKTNEPIADADVMVCNDRNYCLCEKLKTDQNGYYSDTIFIYYENTPHLQISVYDECLNEMHIVNNIEFVNDHSSNDIYVCRQNEDNEVDFFYKNYTNNNIVYFASLMNFQPDSIVWDFGDGFTGNKPECSHRYSNDGIYNVILTAYWGEETYKISKSIQVGTLKTVTGEVKANGQNLPDGYVLAVYKEPHKTFIPINYAKIKNGTFEFQNLMVGNYLFYAFPNFKVDTLYFPKYIATYYSSATTWTEAIPFDLKDENVNVSIDLTLGNEFYYGDNQINIEIDKNNLRDLNFVNFVLMNENGEIINSKYAKYPNKSISFNSLPNGIFWLRTEVPGQNSEFLKIDLQNQNVSVKVKAIDGQWNFVLSQKDITPTTCNVFPNPCENKIMITGIETQGKYVQMYDVNGNIVLQEYLNDNSLNIEKLEKGIYFLKIFDNLTTVKQTIIIKK